jgi:hypothetical protein
MGPKAPSTGCAEKSPKMNKPLRLAATDDTPGSDWEKTPKKSLPSVRPQLYGLGTADGVPTGGDSARPQVEKMPQSSPQVSDSLAKDPDFIKAGCHIEKYITVVVNSEEEQAEIQALCSDLDSASLHINVSCHFSCFVSSTTPHSFLLFPQKIIDHSKSKDKFLRASLRTIFEAQDFEDELKWKRAMNQMLLA